MNRGRGRGGGRGRGRGRGASWHGPRLPAKLTKEMFGADGGAGGRSGSMAPRKERRKAERQAKRGGGVQPGGDRQGGRHAGARPQGGRGRAADEEARHGPPPSKRQRVEGQARAPPAPGNKFSSLLPASAGGRDAEKELQRELARKLGLKKGKKEAKSEDGLDDLLEGFGGMDDGLSDSELDSDGAPHQPVGRRGKQAAAAAHKQQRGRVAGSDSDSGGSDLDLSEGESDESGSEGGEEMGLESDEDMDSGSDLEGALLGGSDSELDGGSGSEGEQEEEELSGLESGSEQEGGSSSGEEEPAGSSDDDEGLALGSSGDESGGGSDSDSEQDLEEEEGEGGSGGSDTDVAVERSAPAQQRKQAAAPAAAGGKYVPPAARRALQAAGGAGGDEEAVRIGRRVRGLLNRLAEANIQGIVGDLAALYGEESRRAVSDAVCSELLQAAAEGPRASDRFAAVTAAAVAGLAAATNSSEIIANFLDRLAGRLEAGVSGEESLTCHNLAMVAANLYTVGAIRPDLIYSLLNRLKARFSEADVVLLATLLRVCGLALRGDDPVAMRDFVVAVHARAAEVGGAAALSTRARSLLELVVDVKNNRKREAKGASAAAVLSPAVGKWLKSLGVAEVSVGGITWGKILTQNKKGIWWLPTAADAVPQEPAARAALKAAAAAAADKEGGVAGPELLKLAAALRMNTDVRRAVFCIVMGSEDCMDAFEKLLRLPLKGEQEREVVRVTAECCLQEKAWNPYYALLLAKLCEASKSHKMTLQYCLWDHIKEVSEGRGMEVRRMTNLARLLAQVIVGGGLPSTALKVVEFAEGMSAREVLFWRIFFEHLLSTAKSRQDAAALFQKIAAQPALKQFKIGLALFLRRTFGPWLAAKQPGPSSGLSDAQLAALLSRLQAAEKALGTSVVA